MLRLISGNMGVEPLKFDGTQSIRVEWAGRAGGIFREGVGENVAPKQKQDINHLGGKLRVSS